MVPLELPEHWVSWVTRPGRGARPGPGRAEGPPVPAPNPVLCVHNLSRFAQPAELDLARWTDRTPVELLGRIPFPSVGGATYGVTLGPYGFYWFELMDHHPRGGDGSAEGAVR